MIGFGERNRDLHNYAHFFTMFYRQVNIAIHFFYVFFNGLADGRQWGVVHAVFKRIFSSFAYII
ncbi:hypothetical protein D3C80_1986170 [compost metagenome]